jgi:hypothetical protein
MTTARRSLAALVVAILGVLAATATPAVAHDVGSLLSNYETRLTSVSPEIDGIEVAVIEGGNRLEVANRTDQDLVVLGYRDEPYLRIGPEGTYENLNSPATYQNADREATVSVPERADDPDVEPEWRKISDEPVARWHDHRVHWMAETDPPAVEEAPDEEHVVIPGWVVPMELGDDTIEIVGDLVWVPSPSPAIWAVVILVVGALVAASGLLSSWRVWSATAVVLLVAATTVSALGIGFFSVGSTTERLAESLADALYLPFLVVGGVATVVLLVRRHPLAPYLTIFVGTIGGLFGGILQARMLTNSVIPTALTPTLARGLVALILGLGLGMLGAGILAITRAPVAARLETAPTAARHETAPAE